MRDKTKAEPYKSWEYCQSINCPIYNHWGKEKRKEACVTCHAYQMHQYLREHGQILEEGSKLLLKEWRELKAENEQLKTRLQNIEISLIR